MSKRESDLAVERAILEEERKGTHDPRIEKMYGRDRLTIYAFVVALWITLWSVFFFVANPLIHDEGLRWLMIALGLFASIFNSVGMIQNTIRLKQEAVRFYTQDLFWQDEAKRQRALLKQEQVYLKKTSAGGETNA